ncbi:MAG: glutamate 5-kinase [Chloroflexi bacterium]|nr:glutamate 5-kinase [Chloroflexota bacterium]
MVAQADSQVAIGSGGAAPLPSTFRRVVVKVGTNVLTGGTERLNLEGMAILVGQIAALRALALDVVLVSSGAIAAGRHVLGQLRQAGATPRRQVFAAVGQSRLMQAWDQLFSWHDLTVAQTLLTRGDLADRQRYLNARNTLLGLLELGVVPIVNENDVVAVDEIREAKIGDNDNLSAMVANLVDADLLVMLTDTGGLFTADPRHDPTATLIPRVERVDATIEAIAGGAGTARGIGGMTTKVQAARTATASGVAVIIASGHERDALSRIVRGEQVGTLFVPAANRVEARRRWMLGGFAHKGQVVVDDGARRALCELGRSLLPAGIVSVGGRFDRGDTVAIVDATGRAIAYGITSYAADDVAVIRGRRSRDIAAVLGYDYGSEVIHRNNLVLV